MKFITIMVVTVALSASSARAAWAPKAVADAASAAGLDKLLDAAGAADSHLSQTMTVTYSGATATSVDACGGSQLLEGTSGWSVDPLTPSVRSTADARTGPPAMTFTCTPQCASGSDDDELVADLYTLIVFDAFKAPYSNVGYGHHVSYNIECQEGVGDASTGTVLEINPGIAFMPFVTFENEPHAYNWFVFRQPNGAISPSTATLNTLVTANQNFQFDVREAVTLFGLQASDLVARSWQLFTVSYFSASVFAQSALTSAEFRSLEQQSCGNLATAHVVPAASTQGISSTYMTDGFSDLKALANVNFASTSISTSKVCGIDTSFSSVSLSLPPTSPGNEIGSEVTRDEPTVEVLCEDGKFYHLLVIDGGDNGTPSASHAQLVRINAACDADGTATVSGGDTLAGTSDSFTYSAPAPTAATSRKFVWFVWETTEQVSPSTDDIDALLAANTANTFTIAAFRAALSLNGVAPYATSWANVRTELYSAYTLASDSATADQVPQVCRTLASRVGDAATAFGLADFVADGVSSLSQLVDVVFPAQGQDNDIGELCGDTSARLPAVSSLRLDPLSNSRSAQTPGATLYTTLDTRGQPSVTFGCASGDQYALLLFDPYAVPSQNGFLHWAVINIPCTAGTASADDGETYGGDTADGFPYFPPANFEQNPHQYSFLVFRQPDGAAITPNAAKIAEFRAANNAGAVDVQAIVSELGLGGPVARSWIPLRTSTWSAYAFAQGGEAFAPYLAATCANLALPDADPLPSVRDQITAQGVSGVTGGVAGLGLVHTFTSISWSSPAATIPACGSNYTMAAVERYTLPESPAGPTSLTSTEKVRGDPTLTFTCDAGGPPLTLVVFDPVSPAASVGQIKLIQHSIPCGASGIVSVSLKEPMPGSRFADLAEYTPPTRGDFAAHAFTFLVYTQQVTSLVPADVDIQYFAELNQIYAFDLTEFTTKYNLGLPVAQTWVWLHPSAFDAYMLSATGATDAAQTLCAMLQAPFTPMTAAETRQALGSRTDILPNFQCALEYSVDVVFSAEMHSGYGCGIPESWPAFSDYHVPASHMSHPVETVREAPDVTFACADGQLYQFVAFMSVSSGGIGMASWIVHNIPCVDGRASVADGDEFLPYSIPTPNDATEFVDFMVFRSRQLSTSLSNADVKEASEARTLSLTEYINAHATDASEKSPVARSWMRVEPSIYSGYIGDVEGGCSFVARQWAQEAGAERLPFDNNDATLLVRTTWNASAETITGCGISTDEPAVNGFSPLGLHGGTYPTTLTRGEPTIEGACESGLYAAIIFDSSDVGHQTDTNFCHKIVLNVPCVDSQLAVASGTPMQNFEGFPPANPFDEAHVYNTLIYQQAAEITPTQAQIDSYTAANGNLGFSITNFASDFSLSLVAHNWVKLVAAPFSAQILGSVGFDAFVTQTCETLVGHVKSTTAALELDDRMATSDDLTTLVGFDTGKVTKSIQACNRSVYYDAAPFSFNGAGGIPLTPTSWTAAPPVVTFGCSTGKLYSIALFDPFNPVSDVGYLHWAKINIACPDSGMVNVTEGTGGDVLSPLFHPANFEVARHDYSLLVFEQSSTNTLAVPQAVIDEMMSQNQQLAFNLTYMRTALSLGNPIGWTFAPLTVSPYSAMLLAPVGLDDLACAALSERWATTTGFTIMPGDVDPSEGSGSAGQNRWNDHSGDGSYTGMSPAVIFAIIFGVGCVIFLAIYFVCSKTAKRDTSGEASVQMTTNPLDQA